MRISDWSSDVCSSDLQSVALDISSERGAQLIRELAAQCDILVENFKVGGLRKYGLDYESIKAINPALIYCSITGFGKKGPYASRPGYDFMIQGMGGLMRDGRAAVWGTSGSVGVDH